MLGLFRCRGWDAVPSALNAEIRARLGPRFAILDRIAKRHNLLKQRLLHRAEFKEAPLDKQLALFAGLLTITGNRIARRGDSPGDAEAAYHCSLRLMPERNPAHVGLANLYFWGSDVERAETHAVVALEVVATPSSPHAPSDMTDTAVFRQASRAMAQIVGRAEEARRLHPEENRFLRTNILSRMEEAESLVQYAKALDAMASELSEHTLQRLMDAVAFLAYRFGLEMLDAMQESAKRSRDELRRAAPHPGALARLIDGMADMSAAAGYAEPVVRSLQIAQKLSPRFLDCWVTHVAFRYEGVVKGSGYEDLVMALASTALDLARTHQGALRDAAPSDVVVFSEKYRDTAELNLLIETLERVAEDVNDRRARRNHQSAS